MALDDEYFYDASTVVSYLMWDTDSAENGGLIEGSSLELRFEGLEEHASEPEILANTYTSDGANVVKVAWTDRSTSLISFLYYSLNLGINSDPAVDTSTTEFKQDIYGTYSVDYNSSEKDALLSQYKRYASTDGTLTTFSEELSNSISSIVETTAQNEVTVANLMNFKKSPSTPLRSAELQKFSTGRSSSTSRTTTSPTTSMTKGTTY
jgi:hypothetical protein|tara:strand:+ start:1147 stop:1770 length:624 start_codon:yes stop_codon:yes gene_type:complete